MPLPAKSLDQLTESDLTTLIVGGEAESKTIEYKELLPGNSDSDKKEFLYDLSSFANAAGGTLIYGMKAKDGVPIELTGLSGLNPDAEKLRLQAIIQSGLQPRISGVEIEVVPLANDSMGLLIRVSKSWSAPHMVTFKGGSKFYSRHSNGKYQLDVGELRAAFVASETVAEKAASFRTERLSKILNNETPVTLTGSTRVVLHLMPLVSFSPGNTVDLKLVKAGGMFEPIVVANGFGSLFNFEGCYVSETLANNTSVCYTQVFRSGCMEIVDSWSIREHSKGKILYAKSIRENLLKYLPGIFKLKKALGIDPPILLALSLLNVRNYEMQPVDPFRTTYGSHPIDRDHLLMPEILLEDYTADIKKLLKPSFDVIYNACGHAES